MDQILRKMVGNIGNIVDVTKVRSEMTLVVSPTLVARTDMYP